MHKFLFWTLLIAILGNPVQAATSLQDYAYQAEMTSSDQELQRLNLPVEVLLAIARQDLSDVEVFDVSGKALPLSILKATGSQSEHQLDLAFYEFNSFQKQHSKIVTTREQSQQQGQLSELQTTETIDTHQVRKDYLIELAPKQGHINRIELTWTHEPASQLLELKVESGNQLDKLRTIKTRKSLTNLDSDKRAWRSIEGIPKNQKFLRITPLKKVTSFELKKVLGHYRQSIPAPKLSHRIDSEMTSIDKKEYYSFDMPSVINAESIRIIPKETHSVISGDLYASHDEFKNKRRVQYGFRQHNITDSEVKASKPIKLPQRNNRHLWFTSRDSLSKAPEIELTYPVYEVVFLGNSNGPYTLAWGNYESKPRVNELSTIMQGSLKSNQQRAELVSLKTIQVSGGASRLAPEPVLPWQKWLLWAILVAAVVITGKMAISLFRDMNRESATGQKSA